MPSSDFQAREEIRPWLSGIARVGFAAKGAIYVGLGLLALSLAAGFTAETHDTQGAIEKLASKPFGKAALLGLAFGLLNFAVWNLVQCLWDPERVGRDWIGRALRILFGMSACLNGFLAYQAAAVGLGRGWGGQSGDAAVRSWIEWVLYLPGGRALVLVSALVMAVIAVAQIVRLFRGRFMDVFSDNEMKHTAGLLVKTTARLGFVAQAIVVGLLALFLWRAGLTREASEAGGFTKALATLLQQPYGRWLLGVTAVGVTARGLFIWLMVPYREIRLKKSPSALSARWRRAFG